MNGTLNVPPCQVCPGFKDWDADRARPNAKKKHSCRVEELRAEDYRRIKELCDRYADADIGFVDAAVLALVERLNEPKLATLDHRHFDTMRPRHVEALALVPE